MLHPAFMAIAPLLLTRRTSVLQPGSACHAPAPDHVPAVAHPSLMAKPGPYHITPAVLPPQMPLWRCCLSSRPTPFTSLTLPPKGHFAVLQPGFIAKRDATTYHIFIDLVIAGMDLCSGVHMCLLGHAEGVLQHYSLPDVASALDQAAARTDPSQVGTCCCPCVMINHHVHARPL